jgi:hypothetical protein
MKFFWVGGAVGFILGAAAVIVYLSLATLFSANAKAAFAQSKAAKPLPQDGGTANDEAAGDKTRSVGA